MSKEQVYLRHMREEGYEYYEDCPICRKMQAADNEGRYISIEEFMQVCGNLPG